MKLLEDMIKKYGEVRPGNVLKVDGFLNHRIDVDLVKALGEELHKEFRNDKITKILTIESSGIAIAMMTAQCFGVPMVFAKKRKTINLSDDIYTAPVHSYTNNKDYDVMVSKDYIDKSDVLLIVDDFLANGCALRGLIKIAHQAGATVAGAGIAIEKGFQGGGDTLRAEGLKVVSLAIIDKMTDDSLEFRKTE